MKLYDPKRKMNSFDDRSVESYFHTLVESGESSNEIGAYIEPDYIIFAKRFLQYIQSRDSHHSELLMVVTPSKIAELNECET
jgi:hypothetical protein